MAGSLGAPGVLRFGGGASILGDFVRGSVAEEAGNASGQIFDYATGPRTNPDFAAFGFSSLIGGTGSVVGGAVINRTGPVRIDGFTLGQNNWASVYQGRLTARENGYIYNISPLVSARGAAGNSARDLPSFIGGNIAQTYLGQPLKNNRACLADKTKC